MGEIGADERASKVSSLFHWCLLFFLGEVGEEGEDSELVQGHLV